LREQGLGQDAGHGQRASRGGRDPQKASSAQRAVVELHRVLLRLCDRSDDLKRCPLGLHQSVAQVTDATAGARHPELGDGYAPRLVNFGCLASGVVTTDKVVAAMATAR
jgi:hypothetical protein